MRGRGALAALAFAACGGLEEPPAPHVRVSAVSPSGEGVDTLAVAELAFTGPVDPAGLVGGARLLLVRAEDADAAAALAASEAGAAGSPLAIPAAIRVEDEGSRAVLAPRAPLAPWTAHALVLAGARDPEGRVVLDAAGRPRPLVARFTTGAPAGPPPRLAVSEVRADAATPEAGGEYVEVVNAGEAAVDLAGFRLAKRTASGATAACTLGAAGGAVPQGGVALVVGGAYDGRYVLPAAARVHRCGGSAPAGGLGNDPPPALAIVDPGGTVLTTFGVAGAPVCPEAAAHRVALGAEDGAGAWRCGGGTPGVY